MRRYEYYNIIMIAIVQIFVALYSFYIFYLRLKLKTPLIFNVAISFYIIHLVNSAISTLKFENSGRILSITNLMVFAIFLFIGMLFVDTHKPIFFLFCILFFLTSVYFLTRRNTKQLFKNINITDKKIFICEQGNEKLLVEKTMVNNKYRNIYRSLLLRIFLPSILLVSALFFIIPFYLYRIGRIDIVHNLNSIYYIFVIIAAFLIGILSVIIIIISRNKSK